MKEDKLQTIITGITMAIGWTVGHVSGSWFGLLGIAIGTVLYLAMNRTKS